MERWAYREKPSIISNLDVVRKILDPPKIPIEVDPAPLTHGPWPSQTMLDVLKRDPDPSPERDRIAHASACCPQLQTFLGHARGRPPSP